MRKRYWFLSLFIIIALTMVWLTAPIQDPSFEPPLSTMTLDTPPNKAATDFNRDRNLYFGDLHIHTSYSTDAYVMGVRAFPDHAYLFAKGAAIQHANGAAIQLQRPLDFAAVTDHAEYLGMMRENPIDSPLQKDTFEAVVKDRNRLMLAIDFMKTVLRLSQNGFATDIIDERASEQAWQAIINSAQRHNNPGVFTTFVGFEWSSQPGGANLHRNVIFNHHLVPQQPFSALMSEDPEALWHYLKDFEAKQPATKAIAIPHNPNLSTGLMYDFVRFDGSDLNQDYANLRNRFEPVSEILQVKGQSETNPILSSEDEFASFEFYQQSMSADGRAGRSEGSYSREALRRGLEYQVSLGFNPFKFGVIGSSDGHNASSPVEEFNYHGKLPMMDGTAGLRTNRALFLPDSINRANKWGSGGLVAAWATENTRDGLFEAMQSKQTYATSGSRIRVRLFAGWQFPDDFLTQNNPAAIAYQHGVPMGSEFTKSSSAQSPTQSPTLVVWASKDPDSANLDRIQIIKGWVDANGQSHEKIINVAASDNRAIDPISSKVAPLPSSVDLNTATYSDTIGAAQLSAIWTDEDFNPEQEAFYYARVLEIETPRWSTYDAVALNIEPQAPTTIQERAITSAIWYSPAQ